MRILLLGEYSGFFKNLKEGFQELGHEVTLIAQGDGWKKIDGANISLNSNKKGFFGKVEKVIKAYLSIYKMKNYDVVIIINPDFFKIFIFNYIIKNIINFIKKRNLKIYLSACGADYIYINYGLLGKLKYWPNFQCDEKSNRDSTDKMKYITYYLAEKADGIIPTFYDYAVAWRESPFSKKVKNTIPLPINSKNIKVSFNIDEKIIFFHGLNRECHKGTKYIKKALENMKIKHPNDIEIIIDGKIPLNLYLQILEKSHVVIDQCKAYSYGSMNSLYSLAMGKVVMSNLESECLNEYELKECPVIGIKPDTKYIEKQIEYILENKHLLSTISRESRNFIEQYHDSIIIAKKYISLFQSCHNE